METDDTTKKPAPNIPAVETFTGDMVQVIEGSKGGAIKKIIQEQEVHEQEKELSPASKRNRLFMIFGGLLVLLALGLLTFIVLRRNTEPVAVNPDADHPPTIIFTDSVALAEIGKSSKDEIVFKIFNKIDSMDVPRGSIGAIYPTENQKIIGLRRFLTLIKSSFIPSETLPVGDNFLMGAVGGEAKHFFMLIRVRSFIDVFEVMRVWENKLFDNLHGFFGIAISSTTNILLTKDFEDGIVENKNARILYDADGNIVLMYIFADENSLIITNNRDAAREVMLRLASSRVKK